MASFRRTAGWLLGCLFIPAGVLVAASVAIKACFSPPGYTDPTFTYANSPDGRYTVIDEYRLTWLDRFSQLWIAPSGETRRKEWHLIGPEVDGIYRHEWTSNSDLLITTNGWPKGDYGPDGFQVERWRDVRIETRQGAEGKYLESPDELYHLVIWTYRDSKGRRSAARLDTSWKNEQPDSVDLVDEGPWDLDAVWISKDRLEMHVHADPGVPLLEMPQLSWRGIEISFVSGTPRGR